MSANTPTPDRDRSYRHLISGNFHLSALALPAAITRAASQNTYQIIGSLVDRDRTRDAFRAYAYFRWVDDQIDEAIPTRDERIAFVERQQAIVDGIYAGERMPDLSAEEQMAVDLIGTDAEPGSGLSLYFQHMMAVMAFDAGRRGRLISAAALDKYTHDLAVAVTEALHYFIGHDDPAPQVEMRYHAVTAAHITHMLRDTCEDIAAGYFNIPREVLDAGDISAHDVHSDAYRAWVEDRVQLARDCFHSGRDYLAQVRSARCRIAGHIYSVQFERELDALERSAYFVRSDAQTERI